ncbi:MAG: ribonuclease [Bacilli bacterium]|nr:ribonuclease [Bacilli bacterium]
MQILTKGGTGAIAKQKYYVVWVGKKPGIYTNWTECQAQVNQFFGAKFKSYESEKEAEAAYKAGPSKHWGQGSKPKDTTSKPKENDAIGEIELDSISVDVGCSGNPGIVEYKGVDTRTSEVIFSAGPISKGTNNLGEFLAIVHALAYLEKSGSKQTVYSDSRTAMKWVKQKEVASTLARDETTKEIWQLVDRAVNWLKSHRYENKVLKWETKVWGEIKADYGRK